VTDHAPRRLVTIAAINGAPARILSAVVSLAEIEARLDAAGYSGVHRAAVLDAWRSIEEAGRLHVVSVGGNVAGRGAESAPSSEERLTSEEAGAVLHVTPSRVRQLARSGELPGRQAAGRWSFHRGDVVAYRGEKV